MLLLRLMRASCTLIRVCDCSVLVVRLIVVKARLLITEALPSLSSNAYANANTSALLARQSTKAISHNVQVPLLIKVVEVHIELTD